MTLFFYIFFRNELKSIEINSSFAIRCRNVKIIKKKSEDHTKDVKRKELLELFNRFYKKFIKSTFYCCIKAWCNKTKLITERERFRCVRQNLKNQSRQIHFDSKKNHLLNRLKKRIKKKFNIVINMLTICNAFTTLTQRIKNSQFFKNDLKK